MVYIVSNPRCIMYTFGIIAGGLMGLDLVIYPWNWHKFYFYLLCLACLYFRILNRNGFAIFMHVLTIMGICVGLLCCILVETKYNIITQDFEKNMRANFYLLLPLFIWFIISIIMFLSEFKQSELYKAVSVAIHSFVGVYITMVFFWFVCFFQHGDNSALLFEMFYMLCFLFIMLTPEMAGDRQVASSGVVVVDC